MSIYFPFSWIHNKMETSMIPNEQKWQTNRLRLEKWYLSDSNHFLFSHIFPVTKQNPNENPSADLQYIASKIEKFLQIRHFSPESETQNHRS